MLPKEKGRKLYGLWQEFEAGETAEARFAHAMDNIQPMMLNDYTDGKAWQQFGVSLSKIYKRNELTPKGSRVLWSYAKERILAPNVAKGRIRGGGGERGSSYFRKAMGYTYSNQRVSPWVVLPLDYV